jgi:hypothetical protein
MYQVLGPSINVLLAAWLTASIMSVIGAYGLHISLRIIVIVVDLLVITLISSNMVWRFVWNRTGPLGEWLSKTIFPDLNGTYDVVLESNWPVVKRMLDASRKDAEPFDPFSLDQEAPQFQRVELEAKIEQTWFNICMSMYPKSPGAVIKQSTTLATIPIKHNKNTPKELIYVFEQENDSRAPTDDQFHLGAARLTIDPNDHHILSGYYWNNRAWQRGVNAAGKIRLVRRTTATRSSDTV